MTFGEPWIKASGMPCGCYDAARFEAICGVNPAAYPAFFSLSRTGLVCILPAYREACEAHFSNVRQNWQAIGISAT